MLAYGYCRYSSEMQNEKSIEQQKEELEEYAIRNDIKIISYYCDEAKSASKDDRENFQNMINDACKLKQVQAILVWKTDRFARNVQDNIFYRNKLKKHGVRLISITQPIDDTTPEGILMNIVMAGMDEYYIANLASNVKRALKSNAKNCQFNGGIPPLGYDVVDKKYVINEEEAEAVKLIFDRYINNYSLADIAIELNKKGFKTKKGKNFGKNSLYDILRNEKYIGNYIFNKGCKGNNKIEREDIIRIEDSIPQIISKEVFDLAQSKKHTRNITKEKVRTKNNYLLTGLIYCGKCNSAYYGYTSIKKRKDKEYKNSYYACTHRNKINKCDSPILKQEELDTYIVNLITKKCLDTIEIKDMLVNVNKEYKKIYSNTVKETNEYKKELSIIEAEIKNIVDVVAQGGANKSILNRLSELEEKQEFLQQEIDSKKNVTEHREITLGLLKFVLEKEVRQIKSYNELKNLVHKWIKKIEIFDEYIVIYFTFSDNPTKITHDETCLSKEQGTTSRYQKRLKNRFAIFQSFFTFHYSLFIFHY